MDMKPVKSSNIAEVGYEPRTKTLAIRFKGKDGKLGRLYHYDGVSQKEYDACCGAESIGGYFAANIRNAFNGVHQPEEEKKDGGKK